MTALGEVFSVSDDDAMSIWGHHAAPLCPTCKANTYDESGYCLTCNDGAPVPMLGKLWPTLTAEQIKAQSQSAYRLKGIFPERGVGMIYGESGSGKSFLAFHLLGHIAVGAKWFGYRTKQARCYYMGLEGFSGLGKRLDLYTRRYGAACEPFLRFNDGAQWSLMVPAHVATIIDTMLHLGMKGGVLVIDTMSQAMAGHEENDAASMTAALKSCWEISKAIEGLVLLVHHTGKDATRGPRGSSAITANLDGLLLVEREGDSRSFTVQKSKDGQAGQKYNFELEVVELGRDDDGDPITSCAVMPGAVAKKGAPKLSQAQRVAFEALRRLQKERATPPEVAERWGEEAPAKLTTLSEWREAAYLDGISGPEVTDDAKRQAFKRAVSELAKRDLVRQCGDWAWSLS